MTPVRYDRLSLALHWLTALAIIGAFALALVLDDMPKGPSRTYWMMVHKSLGVSAIALTLVRILWRFTGMTKFPPFADMRINIAAKLGHAALYALMLAAPVSGAVYTWLRGFPVTFFDLFTIPALIAKNEALARTVKEGHELMGFAIIILALGHAAIAIYHQVVLKDGVLTRMRLR